VKVRHRPGQQSATGPVDFESALRRTGGRRALLRRLIEQFVRETPEELETLTRLADVSDWKQVRILAHRIHGSALVVGCSLVAMRAKEIEMAAENGNAKVCAHNREKIKRAFFRSIKIIENFERQ